MPIEPLLPKGIELGNLLEKLRNLCWGSADILLAYSRGEKPPYGFSQVLDVKDGKDGPVSAADLAVNSWLLNGLELNFPFATWSLLSEETAKKQLIKDVPIDSEWIWILDPLDGTKDFLIGSGEYAVHLALIHQNLPVLGVVLIPEKEELWFGVLGNGAWYENRMGEKISCSFSNRSYIEEMILVSSRSHRDIRLENLINKLNFKEQKTVGSIGCKVATILRGETDVYISLSGKTAPKDWDLAAPEAVLRAAGGELTHADKSPLKYNTGDISQQGCLVATNGNSHYFICQKVFDAIKEIEPEFIV